MSYESADTIIAEVNARGLDLEWLIETHVHADHLSAAPYIQQQLGGKIGISEHIVTVQNVFGKFLTPVPNLSGMAASLINCSPTVTAIR